MPGERAAAGGKIPPRRTSPAARTTSAAVCRPIGPMSACALIVATSPVVSRPLLERPPDPLGRKGQVSDGDAGRVANRSPDRGRDAQEGAPAHFLPPLPSPALLL